MNCKEQGSDAPLIETVPAVNVANSFCHFKFDKFR